MKLNQTLLFDVLCYLKKTFHIDIMITVYTLMLMKTLTHTYTPPLEFIYPFAFNTQMTGLLEELSKDNCNYSF